jgi:putative PIG3 family NAD(P)H quinone oxidoreductase
MKAILFDEPGGPEVLYAGNFPNPIPKGNELLVRVKASALNRADVMQRRGHYPPPPGESPVLGLEIAGEVLEAGPEAGPWKQGDRVCGLVGGGGYAELAVLPAAMAMPVPQGWSWEMAASVPEAFMTAWQSLRWLGRLAAGEKVLIHAGASGVGTAAIQLAREIGASDIFVTASARKHALCAQLGASLSVDYHSEDFREVLGEICPEGIDVIVDCIGGPYFQKNLQALRLDGRLIMLAMMGGATVENTDLMPFLRKRLQVMGSTLRNRSLEYKSRLTKDLFDFAWPLFENGRLKPIVDKVFPVEEVVAAHQYMENNQNQGKIILSAF